MATAFTRRSALGVLGGVAATGLLAPGVATARSRFRTLRYGHPEQVGLDQAALAGIDTAIRKRVGPDPEHAFPGAVALVARHGVVVKHTAFGHAQTYRGGVALPAPRPMRPDTAFDLASCTKVIATTAAVMALVDEGALAVDDPVTRWIPEVGDRAITLRRLLTHTAGLWEWQPTYLWATSAPEAISYVTGLPLRYRVGADRHYSDLGFMLLGEVVRRATGSRLDDYVRDRVHRPLGMLSTAYRPQWCRGIAATSLGNPYEQNMIATGDPYPILGDRGVDDFSGWREHTLVGEVNDGNSAYGFGGVAGHAGLFGTAWDVAVYAQALANGGGYGERRLFGEATVAEFTSDQFHTGQGLGFWTHRFSGVPGLGDGGFGHSGFTGTEFAADPASGVLAVLLTNRLHPDLPAADVGPTWLALREAIGRALS